MDTDSASIHIKDILEYQLFKFNVDDRVFSLSILEILIVIVILSSVRISVWLLKRGLEQRIKSKKIDKGKAYAIKQIFTYLVWTIGIIYSMDYMGVKITVLLAGSTALFVGLGLGLQDAFKDFVSGFIILMERTVTAGDIVEIDGNIGKVLEVGLRTTTLQTRDDIYMIIPNQRLTNQPVINWSQSKQVTRFHIEVGVAYGSDTRLVEKLLLESVTEHNMVAKNPDPLVQFINFGNSSLDFKIHFYSSNLFRIETVKSELRYTIDEKFREHGIIIPFPQRDLWIKDWPGQKSSSNSDQKTDE